MASDVIVAPKSIPASADLSAYQFRFMKIDTSGRLALPSLGGKVATVLQDKPTALGEPGLCCGPGSITKIYVASSVTAGDFIATDATGQAITCVSGDVILGQMLDTVGVNGIGRMLFQPGTNKM